MRWTLFYCLLLTLPGPAVAQTPSKSYTLFHDAAGLAEKPIQVSFLSADLTIRHKYIHSLLVSRFDSISFLNNNPDRQQMHGSPISITFRHRQDSLLLDRFSPEYYAIFVAFHTIHALEYFDSLFAGYVDLQHQSKYSDIELFLGRYANSSPKQYVFTPGSCPSPTIVYHEVGHRVFWQLEDTLHLGTPGDILHMGLLEYFTVSLANHPVVLEGLVPRALLRDASEDVRYPDDILNYPDFWAQYHQAYKDSFDVAPAYRMLYEINLERMASWDSIYKQPNVARNVIEAHKSGMVITHPLWEIRSRIGQAKCDELVKTAMLLIPSTLHQRADYLDKSMSAPKGIAQWYDLVYALTIADQRLFNGANRRFIVRVFNHAGFNLELIRMH